MILPRLQICFSPGMLGASRSPCLFDHLPLPLLTLSPLVFLSPSCVDCRAGVLQPDIGILQSGGSGLLEIRSVPPSYRECTGYIRAHAGCESRSVICENREQKPSLTPPLCGFCQRDLMILQWGLQVAPKCSPLQPSFAAVTQCGHWVLTCRRSSEWCRGP